MLLLLAGSDASPLQGYPRSVCHWYPFIHLCEERPSKVKFLKGKKRDGQGLNPGPSDPESEVLTGRPHIDLLIRISRTKLNHIMCIPSSQDLYSGDNNKFTYI